MSERRGVPRWLVGAVLVTLVAIVGWWLWDGSSADEDAASKTKAADESTSRSESRERSSPAKIPASLERGSVTGRVLDESNAPIEGARVCAKDVAEEVTASEEPFPRCAVSGPDGRYTIEGLFPVEYQLTAGARSFMPSLYRNPDAGRRARDRVRMVAGQRIEGIDIVLHAGGVRVAGVVRDISGGTIEGALVQGGSWWGLGGAATAVSDADGQFELWVKPGVESFTAVAEGYAPGSRRAVAPGKFVELYMTPESVLQGKVVRADTGEPVADALVHGGQYRSAYSARSDAQGRFRIAGLSPGRYKPEAYEDESYGMAAESVQLGLGETSGEIVIEVHPAFMVQGRLLVAGTDGETCPSGVVRLTDEAQGFTHSDGPDENGEVRIEAMQPGNYVVTVHCDDHLAEDSYDEIVIEDESITGLLWEVREALAIRGTVVDSDGNPVAEARVSATAKRSEDEPRGQRANMQGAETEDDGSFEVGGLLPGEYSLYAWKQDRPAPVEPTEVRLESGADINDVEIELPATGVLEGIVVDTRGEPVEDASVRVTSPGWSGSTTMCADDGSFSLPNVRTGSHRALATASLWGSNMRAPGTTDDDVQGERVDIVAGETTRVELVVESHSGVIRGRVVDGDGQPVADAHVDAQRDSDSSSASQGRNRRAVRWGSWNRQPNMSDDVGEFEIDGLVAEATYTVRAHLRGGGETIAEGVVVGSTVELRLMPTGELSGTVRVAGGGVPDQFEIVVHDRGAGYRSSEKFFRSNGSWRISELPAGKYEIQLTAPAGNANETVTLAEGEARGNVDLVVQPKITVTGTIIDLETNEPLPGFQVSVQSGNGFIFRAGSDGSDRKNVSGPDGRFEVANVPTGRVVVLVTPRGFGDDDYGMGWQRRTLAAEPAAQDLAPIGLVKRRIDRDEKRGDLGFKTKQSEPDEEPEARRQLVAFVRPGGPAEAAGLVVGDEIQSVDGHDVTGINSHRMSGLSAVREGTKLVLGLASGDGVTIVAGPSLD